MNNNGSNEDNVVDLNEKKQELQESQTQKPQIGEPQIQQLPTHIQGQCGNCGYKLSLPFPIMPIFNHQVASSVVIPHSKGIECRKCGIYHNIAVIGFNVQLAIVPMERLPQNNEESLIVPVHGKLPGPQ